MEAPLNDSSSFMLPAHLADGLSNATAGAVIQAWTNRVKSHYNVADELAYYVANLDSHANMQRWFNAAKLGMTPRLAVNDAGPSCRLLTDKLWQQLVQLHPEWRESFADESYARWNGFSCDLVLNATDVGSFERFETLHAAHASARSIAWTWDLSAVKANKMIPMQYL